MGRETTFVRPPPGKGRVRGRTPPRGAKRRAPAFPSARPRTIPDSCAGREEARLWPASTSTENRTPSRLISSRVGLPRGPAPSAPQVLRGGVPRPRIARRSAGAGSDCSRTSSERCRMVPIPAVRICTERRSPYRSASPRGGNRPRNTGPASAFPSIPASVRRAIASRSSPHRGRPPSAGHPPGTPVAGRSGTRG